MKAFAEYFQVNTETSYRRKTILQLGEGVDLIGSAVLINPGSATPIEGKVDTKVIKAFFRKNHETQPVDISSWREFNIDPTMHQLSKIFTGEYLQKGKELNGIIQLFNCFYYKTPNLEKALKNFDIDSDFNFNESAYFLDKPVYFGWGNKGKKGELKSIAQKIFTEYDISNTPIYDREFGKNSFYHPGYINRSYKRNEKTIKILRAFSELIT